MPFWREEFDGGVDVAVGLGEGFFAVHPPALVRLRSLVISAIVTAICCGVLCCL